MKSKKENQSLDLFNLLLDYKDLFEEISVKSKTVLLREGEIAKKIFFVKEGCLRIWQSYKGKEITFQFFFENDMVASIESLKHKTPSACNIETIEPTKLFVLTKKNFDLLFNENPNVKDYVAEKIFKRFCHYSRLHLAFLKNNPIERYKELLATELRIIQRIPQHYIASYLGITPVSLSRIRNKISK